MYNKGNTQREIADIIGCSRQNVNNILKCIGSNKRKGTLGSFQKYKNSDLSILSDKERLIFEKRLSGMAYRQIAEMFNITIGAVGFSLTRSKAKLEGQITPEIRHREIVYERRRTPEYRKKKNEWRRNYIQKHPEYLEKVSEYNREYYNKNRERIRNKAKKGSVSNE